MAELSAPGLVVSNNGDMAKVQMTRMAACSGRHDNCPWNALIENIPKEEFLVEAKNPLGAKPGYKVEVEISSKGFYRALFLIYILPLAGLLVGYLSGLMIATLFGLSNYGGISRGIFTAVGLVISLLVIKKADKSYHPDYTITRFLSSAIPGCTPFRCAKGRR